MENDFSIFLQLFESLSKAVLLACGDATLASTKEVISFF